MVVRAKSIAVDSFGAIVQFPDLKAKCPVQHMSEFEVAKPGKKFKVNVLAAYAF
jgi:rRNA biogenesis protein RRP5